MTRKETGMIRHILLIKFKENAEASEVQKLNMLFEAMPNKVEGVAAVSGG